LLRLHGRRGLELRRIDRVSLPAWGEASHALARGMGPVVALALGLALERWRPHERLRPAWGTNLGLFVAGSLATAAVCGACGWTVAAWAAAHGFGLLAWAGADRAAAIVVGLLALDAVSYLWHRLNHSVPLFWRFHQVHHADASFHVTTALRFHPGELLLAVPVRLGAILALGVPPEGVLVFEVVFGAANVLEHGNFDLPRRLDGIARGFFITPALHRAHHTSEWRELDTNFGTIFSIWDRLGRTFHPSEPARRIVTGLPSRLPLGPPALVESLLLPFAPGSRRTD
jgi:sterol desaturase/sphingolipid hydroxylase (fatty acid hydroxylase superfamily)